MKHSTRAPIAPLAALLAVALFPFGWLAEVWPLFDGFTELLFASEAAHAVGHSVIFALIGATLLLSFPALRRRPWLYLLVILAVGLGQEGFQLLYKARPIVLNDVTDLATDLVAAGVVWALWYIWSKDRLTRIGNAHAQAPGRRG